MSDNQDPLLLDDEGDEDIVAQFLANDPYSRGAADFDFEAVPDGHRSGFIAVVGRPNVGKSTLINAIIGQKIAIVTPKPQTTRMRQLGILTTDKMQAIFVDTPGIHKPKSELGTFMVEVADQALRDADIILFVSDASSPPTGTDRNIAARLEHIKSNSVLRVLNKVDLATDPDGYLANVNAHLALTNHQAWFTSVATNGKGVDEIIAAIENLLPKGPLLYPPEEVSDLWVREIVTELIREQVLLITDNEVPHATAVLVEEYLERDNGKVFIRATIFVERDGQKGILVGKGGKMIKRISQQARQTIEAFIEQSVFLDLQVKVLKNWRTNEQALRRLGYRIER